MGAFNLNYASKKVIVTGGGGSGMGAAAVARLVEEGANVHVVDIRSSDSDGARYYEADLKDPKAISDVVEAIGSGIDAVFNCVGVPGNRTSALDTFLINFAGVRHLTDQAFVKMNEGGAICTIASNAGQGWADNLSAYAELIEMDTFDGALEWFAANEELLDPEVPTSAYRVSKQAVNAWTVLTAGQRGERGVRQNAIMPGFTQSPMGAEFREILATSYFEEYPTPLGRHLVPEEPANALLFLNSDLATGINGVSLLVDGGAGAVQQVHSLT